MPRAYQFTADGYYAGEIEDHGLLPHNATYTAPPETPDGQVARWTGEGWTLVEDHKGKSGYLDGQPHTITEYGPLPEGGTADPPQPTPAEQRAVFRAAIAARKNEYRDGGFVLDGTLWDSDPAARLAYAELAQRLVVEPDVTVRWKASEGLWLDMDAGLFRRVYEAGARHIAAAFSWQESEESRLAATPDEDLAVFAVSEPAGGDA
jgi:hypothetical protein